MTTASNRPHSNATPGKVYLVGAGPGDPDLLTLKAARLLALGDIVLHDDLVPEPILALAGPRALVVSVGKRCGAKRVTQAETNSMMVNAARAGLTVVRLKVGDPLVFGRAAEEMDALSAAGILCEVVPGITAAFAAAAQLRCSLTDRRAASSILLSTGHRAEQENATSEQISESPTRIVYMPGRSFAPIAAEWLAAGEPATLPCVVVSCAARPEQTVQRITLADLAHVVPGPAPVLLLAGTVLADREAEHLTSIPVEASSLPFASQSDSQAELCDAD